MLNICVIYLNVLSLCDVSACVICFCAIYVPCLVGYLLKNIILISEIDTTLADSEPLQLFMYKLDT